MLAVKPEGGSMFGVSTQPPVQITKDGVTVARSLDNYSSQCRLTNMGAKLVIDAAERANEECGDGTTTSTLVAGYVMQEGSKILMGGKGSINPVELRKGIQKAVEIVCKELDKMSIKLSGSDDPLIKSVALISSNGDVALSDLIYEVHKRIGKDGTISIQEGQGHLKTHVSYIEGYSIDQGYLSPYFA